MVYFSLEWCEIKHWVESEVIAMTISHVILLLFLDTQRRLILITNLFDAFWWFFERLFVQLTRYSASLRAQTLISVSYTTQTKPNQTNSWLNGMRWTESLSQFQWFSQIKLHQMWLNEWMNSNQTMIDEWHSVSKLKYQLYLWPNCQRKCQRFFSG